jgi:hypothetical protein
MLIARNGRQDDQRDGERGPAHFAGSSQPDSNASSGRSLRMTAQRSVSAR